MNAFLHSDAVAEVVKVISRTIKMQLNLADVYHLKFDDVIKKIPKISNISLCHFKSGCL